MSFNAREHNALKGRVQRTEQDVGKLEEYVEQSQCVLIFLSKNYFFSTNCLRELHELGGANGRKHDEVSSKMLTRRVEALTKDWHDDVDGGMRHAATPVAQQTPDVEGRRICRGSRAPPFFAAKPQPVGKRLVPRPGDIRIVPPIVCGRETCPG